MSILPRVVFGVVVAGTIGVIYSVHWQQEEDKKFLRQGVYRDMERQRLKASQKVEQ
eukprot:m.80235 g.80235  ORF g.80235 m.80235 type:complete len:56 (+) comp12748_c0_seq2:137-304(+)